MLGRGTFPAPVCLSPINAGDERVAQLMAHGCLDVVGDRQISEKPDVLKRTGDAHLATLECFFTAEALVFQKNIAAVG